MLRSYGYAVAVVSCNDGDQEAHERALNLTKEFFVIEVIYFNGWGMPLSIDYSGGWLLRNEEEEIRDFPGCRILEGFTCPPHEYTEFMRSI